MNTLINTTVISAKFGKGTVKSIENGKATIEFANETKSLLIRFANLTFENGENVYVKEVEEVKIKKVAPTKTMKIKKESKKVLATLSDLKEYKKLIIFYINRASYPMANVSLSEVMTMLLDEVNKGGVYAKTKRGIKGAITRKATSLALEVSDENIRENNGFSILDNTTGNPILERLAQFRLDILC